MNEEHVVLTKVKSATDPRSTSTKQRTPQQKRRDQADTLGYESNTPQIRMSLIQKCFMSCQIDFSMFVGIGGWSW